jgi:hypothetical protein
MMARVGAKESFEDGRSDLKELADVVVTIKEVERTSEAIGGQIEATAVREREQVMEGKVIPFPFLPAVPKLYITIDGTGVPAVRSETEGRPGKDNSGFA